MKNKLLIELLEISDKISRGEIPEYQHNEFYTSDAFDLLLINLIGPDAFELLSLVCEKYDEIKSLSTNLKGFFYLIKNLVPRTNTTELPVGMEKILFENKDNLPEIIKWYRL